MPDLANFVKSDQRAFIRFLPALATLEYAYPMTTNPFAGQIIPEFTRADRLRKAREVTGMNQSAFAEHIGISPRSVGNYENGSVAPRQVVLNAWALGTGVPLEWLETGIAPTSNNGGDGSSMVNIY